MEFRWIEWNRNHIAHHGVMVEEAEHVVRTARRPWPERRADERWLVMGRGTGGRLLQVAFVRDPDDAIFVIHARPLDDNEKRRYRRRGGR